MNVKNFNQHLFEEWNKMSFSDYKEEFQERFNKTSKNIKKDYDNYKKLYHLKKTSDKIFNIVVKGLTESEIQKLLGNHISNITKVKLNSDKKEEAEKVEKEEAEKVEKEEAEEVEKKEAEEVEKEETEEADNPKLEKDYDIIFLYWKNQQVEVFFNKMINIRRNLNGEMFYTWQKLSKDEKEKYLNIAFLKWKSDKENEAYEIWLEYSSNKSAYKIWKTFSDEEKKNIQSDYYFSKNYNRNKGYCNIICYNIMYKLDNKIGLFDSLTKEKVRKSYKKLALIYHPDKGGDESIFNELTESYRNLISILEY